MKCFCNLLRKIVLLAVVLLLCSCGLFFDSVPKGWDWDKRIVSGMKNFPSTDTIYGKGFKDGCYAAWDSVLKGYLSDAAKSTYNTKLAAASGDYNTGWWDGFEQCVYAVDWDAP